MTKRPPAISLPDVPPHWHPPGCDCEPVRPYVRVSKIGTREEVISPELQLRSQVTYAKRHNLLLLKPVYDIDRSGRTFRKRSVDGIIAEIEKGAYHRVLLWKWSRWARNREESAKYLKRVRLAGGRVDSATEDFDQETAIGRLQWGVMQEFDQYLSDTISETWHSVHTRRREAGLPHGGRPRFGYTYIKEAQEDGQVIKKSYAIDETTAPHLRQAYRSRIDGEPFAVILERFQRAGLKTTMGNDWTLQALVRMMDTGFAAGLIRERSKPDGKPANSLGKYDSWRQGAHPAIIDRETWEAYKALRMSGDRRPTKSRRATHELSAILFCTECRRRMILKYTGAYRTKQWQCAWQKTFHPDVSVTVGNRAALAAVREWVKAMAGAERDLSRQVGEKVAERIRRERERDDEQERIQREIQGFHDKIENLLDLAEDGLITREKFEERRSRHQQEIDRLTKTLAPVPARPNPRPDYSALRTLDEVWEDLLSDPARMRDVLLTLISRVEVSPRSASSTNRWAFDRVHPKGVWEEPELTDWLSETRTRLA